MDSERVDSEEAEDLIGVEVLVGENVELLGSDILL